MNRVCMLLCVLAVPSIVRAHAVGVEVKQKGDTVTVEAFFDDDTPADEAKVQLVDASGTVVLEGVTDAKGVWTFPTPKPGEYKVKVDAGAGHRTSKTLTIAAPPTEEAPAATISDGPTREEFTRTPWGKIALGLALLGGVTGLLLLRQRAKKTALDTAL